MRFVSIVFLCVLITLFGCKNGADGTANRSLPQEPVVARSKLGNTGTKKLLLVLHQYFQLKEDLTILNEVNLKSPYELSAEALSLAIYLRKDSLPDPGIISCLDTIRQQAKAISDLYDETGERKRIHFNVISSALYGLLQKAELKNVTIYRMHSNNAFNDKGAYWLSSDKEIRNPYFGKKLLEEGEITDTLK